MLASTSSTFGRLVAGGLLVVGPLVISKLVVRRLLGVVVVVPPTTALLQAPLTFFLTVGTSVAAMLLGYLLYVRRLEGRPADELRFRGRSAAFGLASGTALIALPMAVLFGAGAYQLERVNGLRVEAIAIVLMVTSTVLLEELVFRGLLVGGCGTSGPSPCTTRRGT